MSTPNYTEAQISAAQTIAKERVWSSREGDNRSVTKQEHVQINIGEETENILLMWSIWLLAKEEQNRFNELSWVKSSSGS